jgi:hypothetical protein
MDTTKYFKQRLLLLIVARRNTESLCVGRSNRLPQGNERDRWNQAFSKCSMKMNGQEFRHLRDQ